MKGIVVFGSFFAVCGLFAVMHPLAFAGEAVTPYGDYCTECAVYGSCKEVIPPLDAMHALHRYYRVKGYRVGTILHRGRFMEAEIFKNERRVDKIIFDRKTGRLRSIY